MKRRYLILWLVLVAGCGPERSHDAHPSSESRLITQGGQEVTPVSMAQVTADEDGTQPTDRKIVYDAEVRLVVPDFSDTENAVSNLVKEYDGYLANVSIDRTSGEQRKGRWQIRIPVEQFDAFLNALSEIGTPETRQQTAQDVTEEYVDLEARIKNTKRLEERILALLENNQGEIKDVIEVERELGRVRGEVERMEGRLRYLSNRTSSTTVTIYIREERDYISPDAPTLVARIQHAWDSSLLALRQFGEGFLVVAVSVAPWLVVGLIIVGPPVWWLRRFNHTDDPSGE